MAIRKADNPNGRPVLFQIAVLSNDSTGSALDYRATWHTIAWATTRMWADDIAQAWFDKSGDTVEVWQLDHRGDSWQLAIVRHWEAPVPDEPEVTSIIAR